MKPNTKYFICLSAAFCLFLWLPALKAQQKDFQCWPSAQIGLEVSKKLGIHLEEEVRFRENCSQFQRQINDLGISFKFNKHFKTLVFYRVEANWKNYSNYIWRQGLYADFTAKYGTGRFLFGYRMRFQSDKFDFNEDENRFLSGMVNRHRITAEYNIKNLPLTPFAEGELFFHLQNAQYNMSDYRAWIGLTWAPGKIQKFSLKYGIDQELMKADPVTSYIIAFNYAVNLKL